MRLTPPRRARRRMAGLVMPWMLSLQQQACGVSRGRTLWCLSREIVHKLLLQGDRRQAARCGGAHAGRLGESAARRQACL